MGRGGQVVSVLAFYSDNPSSNPADTYRFFCKICFWCKCEKRIFKKYNLGGFVKCICLCYWKQPFYQQLWKCLNRRHSIESLYWTRNSYKSNSEHQCFSRKKSLTKLGNFCSSPTIWPLFGLFWKQDFLVKTPIFAQLLIEIGILFNLISGHTP